MVTDRQTHTHTHMGKLLKPSAYALRLNIHNPVIPNSCTNIQLYMNYLWSDREMRLQKHTIMIQIQSHYGSSIQAKILQLNVILSLNTKQASPVPTHIRNWMQCQPHPQCSTIYSYLISTLKSEGNLFPLSLLALSSSFLGMTTTLYK